MIPNATAVAEVESTFTGEDVDMEASAEDLAHIMVILSDIYSDPTMAVVREYTVNAIDSHIEAGQTRPVEIVTPGPFSPNLTIRDFGIGMDADDIRKVYSKYGKSTKRLTDLQSGMLGIGAKSAFAYSNGFLVTAIKNGVKTSVSVNRSEDGGGVMTILGQSETTDGNGVTISIPVSNVQEMKNAVKEFCGYLPANTVLVDGEDLSQRGNWELLATDIIGELDEKYEDDEGNIKTRTVPGVVIKNLWRVPDTYTSRVIMGNVPYLPNSALGYSTRMGNRSAIYAEVTMGAAVFEPSRESLKDSPLTRRTEKFIADSYLNILAESISHELDSAPSKPAARKMVEDMTQKMHDIGAEYLLYKGERVPSSGAVAINLPEDVIGVQYGSITPDYGSFDRRKRFNFQTLDDVALIITDAPEYRKPGPVFRQRILNYIARVHPARKVGYGYTHIILLPKNGPVLANEWIDLASKAVSWDVIKKEEVDRSRLPGGTGISTAGKHYVIGNDGRGILRVIDEEEEIVYVTGSDVKTKWELKKFVVDDRARRYQPYGKDSYEAFMALARKIVDDDITIVDVYANRREKFLRDYPQAVPLTWDDLHDKMVAHILAQVSDADILHCLRLQGVDHLALLPEDDEDAQYLLQVGEGGSRDKMRLYNVAIGMGNEAFNKRNQALIDECDRRVKAIRKRYPLLPALPGYINSRHHEVIKKHLMIEFLESQEDENDSVQPDQV